MLEKTPESPLDRKIKPVNPKGNQPWMFIGKIDAEAEAPILWLPDSKNWLIGKDPYAGKDWGQEEKGATEDEMARCYHWLKGHEFEQTPGDSEGQGSLMCCSPWGRPPYVPIKYLAQTKLTSSGPVFTTMLVLLFLSWCVFLGSLSFEGLVLLHPSLLIKMSVFS